MISLTQRGCRTAKVQSCFVNDGRMIRSDPLNEAVNLCYWNRRNCGNVAGICRFRPGGTQFHLPPGRQLRLGPTQTPIHWTPWALSPEAKWSSYEASGTEVKNALSFTSTALYVFIAWTGRPLTFYPLNRIRTPTDGVLNTSDWLNIQALLLTTRGKKSNYSINEDENCRSQAKSYCKIFGFGYYGTSTGKQ